MQLSQSVMKACLALAMLSPTPTLAIDGGRPDKVSFYFAAHEDDWQLFMNPSAFEDVINGAAKTVFVHVTAGDAGLGMGRGDRKYPFYLSRENGAETAIRFMADADAIPAEKTVSHVVFNGHPIYRMGYRNAVGYFTRLPDGNGSTRAIATPAFNLSSDLPMERMAGFRLSMVRPPMTAGAILSAPCARSLSTSAEALRSPKSTLPIPTRGTIRMITPIT
jgi:hypothetical protein